MAKWKKPCDIAKGKQRVCFWQFADLCTRFPSTESKSINRDDFSKRVPVFKPRRKVTEEECRANFIPPIDVEFDRNIVHMRMKNMRMYDASGSVGHKER